MRLVAPSALTSVLLFATAARAETPSLALDRLAPAPVGDPTLTVESPHVRQGGALGLLGSYAKNPLVVRRSAGDVNAVSSQLVLHGQASLRLAGRLGVDVDAPVTISQSGSAFGGSSLSLGKPEGGKLGDVRLGARVLLSRPDDRAGVALSLRAWAPTGKGADYTGADGVRFAPALVFGWAGEHLVASLSLGRTFRRSSEASSGISGSELTGGAGAAYKLGVGQLGVEAFGATVQDTKTSAFARTTTNLEALLVGRAFVGPIAFSAAAGPGIGHGVGTPSWRAVVGIAFQALSDPAAASRDVARVDPPGGSGAAAGGVGAGTDGLAGGAAAPLDTDGDGVPDDRDACPKVVGVAQPDAKRNGCPLDTDGDGIPDAEDACKTVAGPPSTDKAKNGCPGDEDGDGITDDVDACPHIRGEASADPKANGCPKMLSVGDKQIDIRQQVLFETGRDVIRAESFPLLQEIANTMNGVPQIVRVAVDGHTDDVGLAAGNLALSQRRALAVMRWLIAHGVDARRLEARGFGPRRPIADNKTAEGREKNRRVEFIIRKRSPKGAEDWVDGPVE